MSQRPDETVPDGAAPLHIGLLGTLRLARGQAPLALPRTAAARALLAYLALHRGRPLSRDLLAGTFWPDRPDTEARKALSDALWQVRQCLGPASAGRLAVGRQAICLTLLPQDTLDVDSFSEPLRRHRERLQGGSLPPAALSACLSNLDAAIALYRADLLVDCYDDWVLPERERLHEEYLWALEQLTLLAKQWGDDERALAYARRLVAADPLRETAHRELMRLSYALGRHHEALEQYAALRRVLADELGVEPAAATTALYGEIQSALRETGPVHLPAPAPVLSKLSHLPFVGRGAERAALLEALQAAGRGRGGLALVEGAPGVGKTRLVEELVADARWRGFQVGLGRADPLGASVPYQPLVDALAPLLTPLRAAQLAALVEPLWLSAGAAVLPVLRTHLPDLPALDALEPQQEQQRLWEGLARCAAGLAAVAPLLLVFEDVHRVDAATLAVLSYLAHRLPGLRLLVVLTCRGAEARERAVVWEALEALDRALPLRRVPLAAFAPEESAALIQRALGLDTADPAAQALTAALQKRSGHNALFLVETLKAMLEQSPQMPTGGWSLADGAFPLPVPASLQELVGRRLRRLPPALRATVELAAVFGEEAGFALLARAASSAATALADHLGGLCQRGFLAETPSGYRFEHEVVRETVYRVTNPRRRQALHRQVVAALEALQPEGLEALAHHAAAGGDRPRAARYYRQAGERAAAQYANQEAVDYLSRALEFTDQDQAADRYALLLAREKAHDLLGERESQQHDLAELRQLAQGMDCRHQAEVILRESGFLYTVCDFPGAVAAARRSIDLAQKGYMDDLEATAQLVWGMALCSQGECGAAVLRLEQALPMLRAAQLRTEETRCLLTMGNIAYLQGDLAAAVTLFEQGLQAAREAGNRQRECSALNNIATVLSEQHDYGGARNLYEQVLGVSREIGDRRGESLVLGNLARIAIDQGDYMAAINYAEEELRIGREIRGGESEGQALVMLSAAWHCLGDYSRAQGYCEQTVQLGRDLGSRHFESWGETMLSLVHHRRGDQEACSHHCQRALELTRETGELLALALALTHLGHARGQQGHLQDAVAAYQEAMALRHKLGQPHLVMVDVAGLAAVALAQGDLGEARQHVETILRYLEDNTLEGTLEPLWIYLVCYQVLRADRDPRAGVVLGAARAILQQQAGRIGDAEIRRSFLENVDIHRQIVAAHEALRQQIPVGRYEARLPRAGAPTGRPLRDDERVTVAWTPLRPDDEHIRGKTARRQHRLQRLLGEAAAQGAAPTVADLAAALGVDARTIKRDLAALRAAGHATPTRGRRSAG